MRKVKKDGSICKSYYNNEFPEGKRWNSWSEKANFYLIAEVNLKKSGITNGDLV